MDEREGASIARALDELHRLASPFDREADPVHVTGSGVVTGRRGVLLLRHRLLGIWVQPGGHVEPGEAPWDTARRETAEETGLDVRFASETSVPPLLHVDVHPAARGHVHLDLRYRLAVAGDDAPHPPEGESPEVAWYGWDAAVAEADAGLAGLLRHLRASDDPVL